MIVSNSCDSKLEDLNETSSQADVLGNVVGGVTRTEPLYGEPNNRPAIG